MRSLVAIVLKTLLYVLLTAVVLLLSVLIGLQIPAVQTRAVQEVARRLSKALEFPVSVGRVSIKWFDTLALEDVGIQDRERRNMIRVGRLEVDYNLRNLIDSSAYNIHLDEVLLYRPDVRLITNPKTGDLNIDEFIARIEELTTDSTSVSPADSHVPFTVGRVTLAEGRFSLDDPREKRMPDRRDFDYNHFVLQDLHGDVRDLLILGDTISLDISRLRGRDPRTGLTIKRLDTDFLYCAKQMELDKLYAHIGNSIIRNYIAFNYDSPSALGDFNERVRLVGNLRGALVQSEDLGRFSSYIRGLRETWTLTGDFRGRVVDFRLGKADLRFGAGGRSRLVGDWTFRGLPDTDRTRVALTFLPQTTVQPADLRQYYPDPAFNAFMAKLGTLTFDAQFAGLFTDFKTTGTFRTGVGTVAGDVALRVGSTAANSVYTADVRMDGVALGKLFDEPTLGTLTGSGRINGRGMDLQSAQLDVDAQLASLGLDGYNYRNVVARGTLQRQFFDGELSADDPNLGFGLDGKFDLRGPQNRFDVRGTIQRADLRALGYTRDSLTISTELDVTLTGNTPDQLVGEADLHDVRVGLNGRALALDTLTLRSDIDGRKRQISLLSDPLSARLAGEFRPVQAAQDLSRVLYEYLLYFNGDVAARQAYYRNKIRGTAARNTPRAGVALGKTVTSANGPARPDARTDVSRSSVDYTITVRDARPLAALLATPAFAAPGTRLEGQFAVGNTELLTLTLKSDSLRWDGIGLGPTALDVTTSKFTNSEEVLASAVLTSARQRFGPLAPTENWRLDAAWEVDHIDFTTTLQQTGSTNRATLDGELSFKGDAIDLEFRPSTFRLLEQDWSINPQSLVRLIGRDVVIRNLAFTNQNQLVTASGVISPDSTRGLSVEARNFDLRTLNTLFTTESAVKVGGTLNGVLNIHDLYRTAILESNLTVYDLVYQDVAIGQLSGEGAWDADAGRLNVDVQLRRNGLDALTLTGTYAPNAERNALNLVATFDKTDLVLLQPFTKGLLSNVGGLATGSVNVTGPLDAPALNGQLDVRQGRATFDYLKADFTFDNRLTFGPRGITTDALLMRDPLGNTATLSGGAFHDGFKNWRFDLRGDFRQFRILNTTLRDNDLFYGTAFATGRATLTGPLDQLDIVADLRSGRGTKIFIPLDGAQTVSSQEFIEFVNRKQTKADSTRRADLDAVDLSRIQMELNLDVTPDATVELQLDRQTGDIIRAVGAGRIGMTVDTKGDFTMTGTYELERGDYTFTFQNVLNKKFQIRPNSRITWTGDPYGALLDVTAAYTQYTALGPLLQSVSGPSGGTSSRSPDYTRRFPLDLLIRLTGQLTSPDVAFDLDVREYPASADFRQAVTAFEARLQSNEQELNRQVSSVLLFNQLLPEGTGLFDQGMVNTGLANSVGEILSNRISQLASNLNQNLDVGISLGGLGLNSVNDNIFNNLQLRFSYRFLNDRFRISRDGGFTYGQNQTNTASLLGEWTLEYWLRPDGRLRAKMYNRNQQSALSQINFGAASTLTSSGGISLLYTRSFNTLFGPPRRVQPGYVRPPADTAAVPTGGK